MRPTSPSSAPARPIACSPSDATSARSSSPRDPGPPHCRAAAILAALGLHIALPGRVTVIPDWIVPLAEGLLLAALVIAHRRESPRRRLLAFTVIGLVVAANTVTLGALVNYLLDDKSAHGDQLMLSGVDIFVTGVLIFAVLFWELDRGGPDVRGTPGARHPGLLLPADGPGDRRGPGGPASPTTCTSRSPTPLRSAPRTRCL